MDTRRWILEIEQGKEPPAKGFLWGALSDEMRFGESHVVETESNASSLCSAISRQSNALARKKKLEDGKYRVWKLEKEKLTVSN